VNRDGEPKYYPYCAVCEPRVGSSRESAHLGDETWLSVLRDGWVPPRVDHRRPLGDTAAR
jgi:hypothetical protein